jgi:hypothetical protein
MRTGALAEHTRQFLTRMLSICISFPFFKRPLVKEVPTNHAEHTRQELMRCSAYESVSYGYAQHARQKLNAA